MHVMELLWLKGKPQAHILEIQSSSQTNLKAIASVNSFSAKVKPFFVIRKMVIRLEVPVSYAISNHIVVIMITILIVMKVIIRKMKMISLMIIMIMILFIVAKIMIIKNWNKNKNTTDND